VTVSTVDAFCPPCTAVTVVVPAASSVALPLLLMVATAGFEELHLIGPSATSPVNDAVNRKGEFFSRRGLTGETESLLDATERLDSAKKTIAKKRKRHERGIIQPPSTR